MTMPSLFLIALEKIVGSQYVLTSLENRETFSHDETHGLKPVLPDVVAKPASTAEVSEIAKLCTEFKIPLTPFGAGTGKSGGCVAVCGGVVICFSRMNQILDIDVASLTAKVQPGVILGDFRRTVTEKKLYYPPDPASLKWCTLGGNVAENAAGASAVKYGVTRDYVIGLEVVLMSGEVLRIGKNTTKGVTGYDLVSLIVGSEGTLALVTEIMLKLLPVPRSVQTALLVFDNIHSAAKSVTDVFLAGILPKSLELIDAMCIEALRHVNAPYRFSLKAGAAVLVEIDGDEDEATLASLQHLLQAVKSSKPVDIEVANSETQRRKLWDTRHMLSEAVKKLKKYKISEDIVVPRGQIPNMIQVVESLGKKYNLLTGTFGHAGDGNLHTQVLYDGLEEYSRVEALIEELFIETIRLGGTLSGEHGIGIAKKPYIHLEQSNALLNLQQEIKRVFDPSNLLNPGKIWPN